MAAAQRLPAQPVWTILALLALAVAALPPHADHAASPGGHARTTVAPAAVHAEQAPHFEASPLVERPACPTGLLQKERSRLDRLSSTAGSLAPPLDARGAEVRAAGRLAGVRLPRFRAPPLV